ncbi:ROK family protein [Amycolatopsis sp. FDAARGOS 1241]|uniref:ROK family transcriptional regulator n=1 Tax=Amycolatopsis sp. FDAARGOS 1241 TaxID=2778070 RepID=UPI00194E0A2B|nr:ROK family protein [Amycolatopsis sp. FDAARGOS 1241]QRP46856.1 ROK family protein [Amycolatopsis sp. FDAARGOS 1241]
MTRVLRQTTRDLRRHNRAALLSSLYLRGPVSRLELVAESGLSPATVTNVVAELIGDGVVAEAGSVESDGGRPRTLLRVRPEFGQVVGVDVGETHVRAGLFDWALGTLATVRHPLAGLDPAQVVELARAGVAEVLAAGGDRVLGVGVGVPGAVRDGGTVHAPTLGWAGVPFADLLRARVPLPADTPLHLDNRARTLGQAEMWRGAGRGVQRTVIALLGVGVGAAFAAGRGTFPGITTTEWGHTVVRAAGAPCRCGSHGCLEAYVGTEAVIRRYVETPGAAPLAAIDSESRLAEIVALAGGNEPLAAAIGDGLGPRVATVAGERDTKVEIADDGSVGRHSPAAGGNGGTLAEPDRTTVAERSGPAAQTLAGVGEYLGIGIANLINLLAPDRVVLAGSAGAIMGEAILSRVRDAAARHALGYLAEATEVHLGQLGPEAVALGAATLPVAALLASGGRSAG